MSPHMFSVDYRLGSRISAQAAECPFDGSPQTTDNNPLRPSFHFDSPKLSLPGSSPGVPRMACGPAEQPALIPPMKRRLITLSTAGNLKISPLAPQQLQQRRPMAALRPLVEPSAVLDPAAALPLNREPLPATKGDCNELGQEDGSQHRPGLRCEDARPSGGIREMAAAPIAKQHLSCLPPQTLPSEVVRGISCRELRTPSRLVLRPMRLLQSAPDTFPPTSPVSPGVSASPAITAWPGLALVDQKCQQDSTPSALDCPRDAANAPIQDYNDGADKALADGQSFRFQTLAATASENTQYSPSPYRTAGPARRDLRPGDDSVPHAVLPNVPSPEPEVSVTGSPAAGGASTARAAAAALSSSNPADDAHMAYVAADGTPHSVHHAQEVSQQASVCVDPSGPAGIGGTFAPLTQLTVNVTVAVRAKKSRVPRLREDSRGGYVKGSVCGDFDLLRYLDGRDCVLSGGRWISRSQFEKMGGSAMAKWYRSIRVLPDLEPLGEWLERHGLPVIRGPNRRSRKRPALGDSDDEQQGHSAWDFWQATNDQMPGASGRAPDCAMMTALLATAAAAAAAAGGEQLEPEGEQLGAHAPANLASNGGLLLPPKDGQRTGDDGLVQRLLDSWPLSQSYLRLPTEAAGRSHMSAQRLSPQPDSDSGGGDGGWTRGSMSLHKYRSRPTAVRGGYTAAGSWPNGGCETPAFEAAAREDHALAHGHFAYANRQDALADASRGGPVVEQQLETQKNGGLMKLPLKCAFSPAADPEAICSPPVRQPSGPRSDSNHGPHEASQLLRSDDRLHKGQAAEAYTISPAPNATEQRLLALRLSPLRPEQGPQLKPPPRELLGGPQQRQQQDGPQDAHARPCLLLRATLPADGQPLPSELPNMQPYVISVQAPPTMLYCPPSGEAARSPSASQPLRAPGAGGGVLDSAWARRC